MLKEKRRGLGNKYKTREKFIELGADRLGTSRLVKIMKNV